MLRAFCFALSVALFACSPQPGVQQIPAGQLSLSSPAPASWVDDGVYWVSGLASGFDSVSVNGTTVQVHEGKFELEVVAHRGINLLEVSGIDQRGDAHFIRQSLIAGQFDGSGTPMTEAAQLRVNAAGLDAAEGLVDAYIVPDELAETAKAMNPVYEDSYGFWGWEAVTIEANLESVSFEQPDLNLVPRDDFMEMEVTIPFLDIELSVSGEAAGKSFNQPVWVASTAVVLNAEAIIGVNQGRLDADLGDADIRLEGFYIDTSLIPGQIEQALFSDAIREKLEEMILEQIEESVPELLEETLSDLDLTFGLDLMDTPVAVEAQFAEAGVDAQGLYVSMDIQIGMPSQGTRFYQGYLAADKSAVPMKDYQSALYGALSDDLMNRMLFEAWRAGMLEYGVSTEDESLPAASLAAFQAEQGSITIDAMLPPVLAQRNGKLSLQVGELQVTVLTPGGGMGEMLKATVTAYADVEMHSIDGKIKLDMGDFEVHLMVTESDWGASEEAITRLLEANLPIESLLSLVQDFEYPLPSLAGIEIASVELTRDGSGVFTNMAATLK